MSLMLKIPMRDPMLLSIDASKHFAHTLGAAVTVTFIALQLLAFGNRSSRGSGGTIVGVLHQKWNHFFSFLQW
eukprot:7796680-Ditylum_brightwellii.AAC.1